MRREQSFPTLRLIWYDDRPGYVVILVIQGFYLLGTCKPEHPYIINIPEENGMVKRYSNEDSAWKDAKCG